MGVVITRRCRCAISLWPRLVIECPCSSPGAFALVFPSSLRWLFAAALLLFLVSRACPAAEPQSVTLAVPEHEPLVEAGLGIVTEMYRRLGYQLREERLPVRRAEREPDAGETDGELLRSVDPDQRSNDLITVPGALLEDDIVAFTAGQPALLPDGWTDLGGRAVCTYPGVAPIEEKLSGVLGVNVTFAADPERVFRLLKTGHCDFAILPRSAWIVAREAGIGGLAEATPAFGRFSTFHQVARRRAMLVPSLAAVIRQLRGEGFLARAQADFDAAITAAQAEETPAQ